MIKILNTTGINYHLEQIISGAKSQLFLISPYLKLSSRIRELIDDKNKLKIDVRIVYGKKDFNKEDQLWMNALDYVRLSFCENLHAKCYANEEYVLICSLNLYDFSQINNHELGVLISRDELSCYNDCFDEIQRILRLSVEKKPLYSAEAPPSNNKSISKKHNFKEYEKLTSSAYAKKLNISIDKLNSILLHNGYLEKGRNGELSLTSKGIKSGAEFRADRFKKGKFYFLWPDDILDKKLKFS